MGPKQKILVEDAYIMAHHAYAQGQYIMRLSMPQCAQLAKPGQFIHLQCSKELPLRRPYSILNACPREGWVDFMYRVVGQGSSFLARKKKGNRLNSMGPIGKPFCIASSEVKPLLLGGGLGIPPILFLAHYLNDMDIRPVAFLASERPLPFDVSQSSHAQGIFKDLEVRATLTMLEKRGIVARLCSRKDYPGYFRGRIDHLTDFWLANLSRMEQRQTEIFACGPPAMLKNIALLAKRYQIACQVCVEEYMACGVGGCAGCTVQAIVDGKPIMKRVCVDGPVFCADELYGCDK